MVCFRLHQRDVVYRELLQPEETKTDRYELQMTNLNQIWWGNGQNSQTDTEK